MGVVEKRREANTSARSVERAFARNVKGMIDLSSRPRFMNVLHAAENSTSKLLMTTILQNQFKLMKRSLLLKNKNDRKNSTSNSSTTRSTRSPKKNQPSVSL